jgi:hypothetical protein
MEDQLGTSSSPTREDLQRYSTALSFSNYAISFNFEELVQLVAPLEIYLAEWRTLVADCKVALRMLSSEGSLEVEQKRPYEGKGIDV